MKRLTLLRHAKSGWDDPTARDFDRALNAKGRRGAQAIGRHLRGLGVGFDRVVASPALRVTETLDALFDGYGQRPNVAWDRRIYLASAATLLEVVQDTPADAERLLLVGHNPGLEDLVLMLVPDESGEGGRDEIEEKFPTSSLAELEIDVPEWDGVGARGARLTRFVRPRDLDPALGPDPLT